MTKNPQKKAVRKAVPSARKPPRRPSQQTPKHTADCSENAPPCKVGYKRPPKEYQWKPGQSGNPAGRPKERTNLWSHFVKYLSMTPAQVSRASRSKNLTMAEHIAIRFVHQIRDRVAKCNASALPDFIRYLIDRDEGKPKETFFYEDREALTPEECQEIREAMNGV